MGRPAPDPPGTWLPPRWLSPLPGHGAQGRVPAWRPLPQGDVAAQGFLRAGQALPPEGAGVRGGRQLAAGGPPTCGWDRGPSGGFGC